MTALYFSIFELKKTAGMQSDNKVEVNLYTFLLRLLRHNCFLKIFIKP